MINKHAPKLAGKYREEVEYRVISPFFFFRFFSRFLYSIRRSEGYTLLSPICKISQLSAFVSPQGRINPRLTAAGTRTISLTGTDKRKRGNSRRNNSTMTVVERKSRHGEAAEVPVNLRSPSLRVEAQLQQAKFVSLHLKDQHG